MDRLQIEALLNEVRDGRTGVDDALERLRNLPFEDLGFAKARSSPRAAHRHAGGDFCREQNAGAGGGDF